jgi:hypothetical protein
MSDICEDCGRYYFEYGDRVRLVQNHLLTGQVIGEKNWEQEYLVRFGATVTALYFDHVELEPDPEFEVPPVAAAPVPGGEENNVVPFARKAMGSVH